MTFTTDGFLGDAAPTIRAQQRSAYAEQLDLAYECSSTAMRVVALLPLDKTDKGILCGSFFARSTAMLQGAVILAEHGLPVESMTLTRSAIETAFVLGALVLDKVSPADVADSDFGNRRKIGNALLPKAKRAGRGEQHTKLKEFIDEHADAKTLGMERLAQLSGMQDLYDGLYRTLSHFAAHPSVSASSWHYELQGGYATLQIAVNETPKALDAACIVMVLSCAIYERVATTPELNSQIASLQTRVEDLATMYRPWA